MPSKGVVSNRERASQQVASWLSLEEHLSLKQKVAGSIPALALKRKDVPGAE